MGVRPRLKTHRRPLARGDGTVQLGIGTGSIRIDGLTRPERALLGRIDGSLGVDELVREGDRSGIPPERVRALLRLLEEHGATVTRPAGRWDHARLPHPVRDVLAADADAVSAHPDDSTDGYAAVAARADRGVLIVGTGPVASSLAAVLGRAGVERVEHGAHAAETLDWPAAALDQPTPDLVVLLSGSPPDPESAMDWQRRGVAHLPVTVSTAAVSVGPLVVPRRTPCLRCQDLVRTDLDPAWAALRTQFTSGGINSPVRSDSALAAVTTGLVAALGLAHLDGRPLPVGVSLHLELPWPVVRQRQWSAHPDCSCGARRAAARPDASGTAVRTRVAEETMAG